MNDTLDFRDAVFKEILLIMKKNKKVVLLTNDMGAKGLDILYKKFPKRVLNVGICEQHMMSMAGGMAKMGYSVFVYGIISHIIFRALEQIKIDICTQKLPVFIIGAGAGLSYGSDGPTHHALEDVGICKTIPNMEIFNPSDSVIASKFLKKIIKFNSPAIIRLDKEKIPNLKSKRNYKYFRIFGKNKNKIILTSGYATFKTLELVKNQLKDFTIIDVYRFNNAIIKKIEKFIKFSKKIIIIEESISSSLISDFIYKIKSNKNYNFQITEISLSKKFFFGSSERNYMWKKYFNKKIKENIFIK